jgi:hypothetical protein
MVSYRSTDGKQSYHQTDELADAIEFVEHLRNDEAVDHARIFKLEELSFEFRPYFRVELATTLPPPPVTAPRESEWLTPSPDGPIEPVEAESTDDVDPLAAVWTATERTESMDGDGHTVGAGLGRKGLFGR